MNKQCLSLIFASLVSFTLAHPAAAQSEISRIRLSKPSIPPTKSLEPTPEERLVRDVYDKLAKMNRAARLSLGSRSVAREDAGLHFELSNFRVGPIREIESIKAEDLVSAPTGEIVSLVRSVNVENGRDETVSYKAQWEPGQYASMYEPLWTIANLMGFEADKNYDVGEYASYVVSATLEGKTRTYKALVLFHNPYRFQGILRPTFWDAVVGFAGTLTDVWNEARPITEVKEAAPPLSLQTKVEELSTNQLANGVGGLVGSGTSAGPIVRTAKEDRREHRTGGHGQTVGMRGVCFEEPSNQQRCVVEITDTFTYENGTLTNLVFYHANKVLDKLETGTGPQGTQISCYTARGVATGYCTFLGCGFSASLTGAYLTVRMEGGEVWNSEIVLTHKCNIGGPVAGANCTTPGWDGTCPLGTSPNGLGMCCFSGSSVPCTRLVASPCEDGGVFDFINCTCTGCDTCGGSPIIIDIAGDGIALTGPTAGVGFDLNGNGTRDRLGWTQPDSDDAWLALDRNGNGNIDNGAELFGDFTPQPAAPNKNGFLALAEYDKPANGGNSDGVINRQDGVFNNLRLWQDTNHNGSVDPGELHTLDSLNVKAFDLDFKESKRIDRYGNEFRYKSKVRDTRDANVGRWAWDVFLSHR